jgi:hypothetical protein
VAKSSSIREIIVPATEEAFGDYEAKYRVICRV